MTALDKQTADGLRRRAEGLSRSRGITLREAKEIVWADYQAEQARLAQAQAPPLAAEPKPPGIRETKWNDSGRGAGKHLTPEQKQVGKQHVQALLAVLATKSERTNRGT